MFTTLLIKPIFNVLVIIYALIPGHNFGLAIILFTVLVRLLMWPLVKKQLHHAKAMRELQPEIKRIKQATKGDRQKEQLMTMELYKEREINPFASLGLIIVQLPIIIALYSAITRIINDPSNVVNFSYPFVQNLSWLKELAADISRFDNTLFGFIDLSRAAIKDGAWYWPAFIIVALSAIFQYIQGRQLMPQNKDAKKLRDILREASEGKQADQSETAAATAKFTQFMVPAFVFLFTVSLAAALPLYWLTTSIIAVIQQKTVLGHDEAELLKKSAASNQVIEGEVIESTQPKSKTKTKKTSKKSVKKRRR